MFRSCLWVFLFVAILGFLASASPVKQYDYQFAILHTTDVHGFIGGEPFQHEDFYDAQLGDFYDFVRLMRVRSNKYDRELLLFDTGDWVQGTGLSDATKVTGDHIFPVVKKLPYDALTVGNHELDKCGAVDYLAKDFVPYWDGNYTCMNTYVINKDNEKKLLGSPYRVIESHQGARILVFGFLFDFDMAPTNTVIDTVEDLVSDPDGYFYQAMNEKNIDLIVTLGHIGPTNPLYTLMITSIRKHHPDTPLVCLAGHTHRKNYDQIDERTLMMESWWAFHVAGYVEINFNKGGTAFVDTYQQFIENSVSNYCHHLGISEDDFHSTEGNAINSEIDKWFKELGLNKCVGVANQDYSKYDDITKKTSMYPLILYDAYPRMFTLENTVFLLNTGSVRSSFVKGQIILNDVYCTDPFNSTLYYIPALTEDEIMKAMHKLQPWSAIEMPDDPYVSLLSEGGGGHLNANDEVPHYYLGNRTELSSHKSYNLMTTDYDAGRAKEALEKIFTKKYEVKLYPTSYTSFSCLLEYVQEKMTGCP